MGSRVKRSEDDTVEMFREQMGFLLESARRFDEGAVSEAKRIAVSLRVLLHDLGRSKSLFGQVGIKHSTWFIDSARGIDPSNMLGSFPLVRLRMNRTEDKMDVAYVPRLGDNSDRQQSGLGNNARYRFEEWWYQLVIKDLEGRCFSRRQLVHFLSDQDNGAHADDGLDDAYHSLSRLNSMRINYGTQDGLDFIEIGPVPLPGFDGEEAVFPEPEAQGAPTSPVPSSVRQIAWELETALASQFPHLLPNP